MGSPKDRENYLSAPYQIDQMQCSLQFAIPALAWSRAKSTISSTPSIQPSATVWAWVWRSIAQSLRLMAGAFGQNQTRRVARFFSSPCRRASALKTLQAIGAQLNSAKALLAFGAWARSYANTKVSRLENRLPLYRQ